jgi:hypothetical protein
MAYFNHAFCKSFLVDEVVDLTTTTNQTTSDLTAGQLGVVDGSWVGQNPAALSATPANNPFYIAQGSYMPRLLFVKMLKHQLLLLTLMKHVLHVVIFSTYV